MSPSDMSDADYWIEQEERNGGFGAAPREKRRSGVERRVANYGASRARGVAEQRESDRRKSSPSSVEEGDSRNESGPTSAGGGDPLAEVREALEAVDEWGHEHERGCSIFARRVTGLEKAECSCGLWDAEVHARAALDTLRRMRVVGHAVGSTVYYAFEEPERE